jgi:hypothetical protein
MMNLKISTMYVVIYKIVPISKFEIGLNDN